MGLELCILKLISSLILFISNGRAKTKMAKLPFLYCGEFMKISIDLTLARSEVDFRNVKWTFGGHQFFGWKDL